VPGAERPDRTVARVILAQAVTVGLVGAMIGSALALSATARLMGTVTAPALAVTATVAAGGVAICLLGALLPTLWLRRLPTAQILARE
jgi:ABC-type antimicrobial peptide transport system permease subunit